MRLFKYFTKPNPRQPCVHVMVTLVILNSDQYA